MAPSQARGSVFATDPAGEGLMTVDEPGCLPHSSRHVILYDRDCGFCKRSLEKILSWDRRGRLRPVPIQSEEGAALLASIPEKERLDSWHLVTPDKEVLSAGAAAAPLARLLPGGRPLAALLKAFPRTTDCTYRWVAANRGRLARWLRIDASRE